MGGNCLQVRKLPELEIIDKMKNMAKEDAVGKMKITDNHYKKDHGSEFSLFLFFVFTHTFFVALKPLVGFGFPQKILSIHFSAVPLLFM